MNYYNNVKSKQNKENRAIIIGTMAEICMKAKILREKLKKNPNSIVDILKSIENLEEEMILCVEKFNSLSTK